MSRSGTSRSVRSPALIPCTHDYGENRRLLLVDAGVRRQVHPHSSPVEWCQENYEDGPITVTGVPMGVSGQTWAAVAIGISTHPLL